MLKNDQHDSEFGDRFTIVSSTVGQIIVRNAQRRLTGQSLLDRERTFAKLIHYPDRPHKRHDTTPAIGSDDKGRMYLGAIGASEVPLQGGIRESLQAVSRPKARAAKAES